MALYDAIRYASTLTQTVNVGVSLGKDSVCTLDLCCKNFKRVNPYFMYFVKGLSFQDKYIEYLENRYSVKILKIPHWMLGDCYAGGYYRDTTSYTDSAPHITVKDVEIYIAEVTGCDWFATGQMMCESMERSAMIKAVGQVDEVNHRIYPLAEWSPIRVKEYLSQRDIKLSPEYQFLRRSIGDLRPENLDCLKTHFPDDYERVKRVFPYVEALQARKQYEKSRKHAEADERAEALKISEIYSRASSEIAAEGSSV
jgi:3'-phosphoadenosine 5'-phosphosulfate sulfotransferase (PAPS reductase)/FAD synthetase